jgi:ribonuclease HI/pterin-4a-carbinolamine dehydratase
MTWQETKSGLYKKFTFKGFNESIEFVNQIAKIAEENNHHPTIKNEFNTVEIWIITHDAGGTITENDGQLAHQIDALIKPATKTERAIPKEIKLYADGGSRGNPGPSASGFVLLGMDDEILLSQGEYLGITTNNQAEYQALKFGLEEAVHLGAQTVHVYMDSLLVVNQMKGIFKVKNRDLWPIHESIKETAKKLTRVSYTHVPRELNKLADQAVNDTLDAEA